MSLFQSLAEIFTGLPPRRPRRGQPDDQQRSDARSPQQRRQSLATRSSPHSPAPRYSRHIRYPRRRFSPEPQLNDAHLSSHRLPLTRDTAARLQSAQSYDNDFSPSLGPANTREKLRAPLSQFAIDLSACGSDTPQMFGNNQKRNDVQARQEEARLLGARDYKDKDAVPITPGSTLGRRKPPGSFGAFKPTDRISQNSRESGPVRASGKSKPSGSYLSKNRPQLGEALDFEESSRPNKRRRHDVDGELELTEEASVKSGSSAGTQSGPKHKGSGWSRQHEEYRDVEESIKVDRSPQSTRRAHRDRLSSADSYDEQFTSIAAQQRRSQSTAKEGPRQTKIAAIEIPKRKGAASEKARDESESDRQKHPSSTGTRRVSERGESPDELQGEATTQPIPKYLGERQDASARKLKGNRTSPVRKRSPSDIQPTDFAGSVHQRSKKAKRNEKGPKDMFLMLHSLRFGSVNKRSSEEKGLPPLRVSQDRLEFGEKPGTGKEVEIMLRHVRMVMQGIGSSLKVRLALLGNSDAQEGNHIDLEFASVYSKERLVERLRHLQIKVQDKDDAYMEKAFANSEREWAQHGTRTKKPLVEVSVPEPAQPTSAGSVTRHKLSSALQDSAGESSEGRGGNKPKSNTQEKVDGASESKSVANRQKGKSDEGVEIPVKKFRPPEPEQEARSTRRSARVSEKSTARDDDARLERHPSPTDDPQRKKWKKPLVYPRIGKKKAEVSVQDRDRLRDYEFLNDNLIGFYMRFLQDHLERTNKQAAQRIYFFNSYFFDTLTKTPKGERGINYSGVEKWTRSVDLFSYDYIVVPINQDAHWYVAIICNLPNLLGSAEPVEPSSAAVSDKETSIQPEGEVQEILESPEPEGTSSAAAPAQPDSEKESKYEAESPASQQARQSFATMSLGEDRDAAEKDEEASPAEEWPDEDVNPPSPTVEFPSLRGESPAPQEQSASASEQGRKPRKSKKTGKVGPKLRPGQPAIVTFDSLDLSRSSTAVMLREYICREAASKRGVDVDGAVIKGWRAKGIPLQPNFSDCGLYLLAYVEKFVQDPDPFIKKIFLREMKVSDDWPPLGSGLLRQRLRNFLDDLFDEQARLKKDKAEETKPIMADQKPVSFLLGPSRPNKRKEEDDGKATEEHSEPANPSNSAKSSEKSAAKGEPSREQESTKRIDGPAADQRSLLPHKDNPTSKPRKEGTSLGSSMPRDSSPPKEQKVVEVPDMQEKPQEDDRLTQSEPEPSRAKRWASQGEAQAKKSQRKKAPTSAGTDVVKVDDSKNTAEDSETEIQVQVRQTPPPTESERVPKSP